MTKQFQSAAKPQDNLNQSNLITEAQGNGGINDPGYITFFPIFNDGKQRSNETPTNQQQYNSAGRKISTIMMLKSDISNEDKMDLQFTRDKNRDSQEQELLDVDDASDSEEAI